MATWYILGTFHIAFSLHVGLSFIKLWEAASEWSCWCLLLVQVCAEQQCEDEVFPLSVNYLDRVLSVLTVRRSQLQLLAAVCMFIASKFKDTTPLSAHCLVVYTDCSINISELLVSLCTLMSCRVMLRWCAFVDDVGDHAMPEHSVLWSSVTRAVLGSSYLFYPRWTQTIQILQSLTPPYSPALYLFICHQIFMVVHSHDVAYEKSWSW